MLIRSKRSHEGTKGHAIDPQRLEDAEGNYQLSGCPGVLQCGPAKVLRANEGGRCRAISWHGFPPPVGRAFLASALCLGIASPTQKRHVLVRLINCLRRNPGAVRFPLYGGSAARSALRKSPDFESLPLSSESPKYGLHTPAEVADVPALHSVLRAARENESRWLERYAVYATYSETMEQWANTAKLWWLEVERLEAILAGTGKR